MRFIPIALILSTSTLLAVQLHAQKAVKVGLNFTAEVNSAHFASAGIGANLEKRITRHSGIETGIYFRAFQQDFFFRVDPDAYYAVVAERYLSIPVLYKFYSRIVNLSVGPSFDFFVGWADKSNDSRFKVSTYSIQPGFNVGMLAKMSKKIRLSDRFDLEPEIRVNPIFTSYRVYGGAGLALKYKLK